MIEYMSYIKLLLVDYIGQAEINRCVCEISQLTESKLPSPKNHKPDGIKEQNKLNLP